HFPATLADFLEEGQARVPDRVRHRATGRLGGVAPVHVDSHPELVNLRLGAPPSPPRDLLVTPAPSSATPSCPSAWPRRTARSRRRWPARRGHAHSARTACSD